MSKLSNFRKQSVPPHAIIKLGKGEDVLEIAIVLQSVDVIQRCGEQVALYNKETELNDPRINETIFNLNLALFSMRSPDNLNERMADSVQDIKYNLSDTELRYVIDQYFMLEANQSPMSINLLTSEELEELKKNIGQIQLSNLSTVCQAHLKSFLLIHPFEN